MGALHWSAPVPPEEAYRRAGGRRRYNARRRHQALLRRLQVARLLPYHRQSTIATILGVHHSTISRDVAWLYAQAQLETCPHCGRAIGPRDMATVEQLAAERVLEALALAGIPLDRVLALPADELAERLAGPPALAGSSALVGDARRKP